jgi:hypothetical protein
LTSSLTWLDHDSAARERSLRILALFQERESRDELGLGGIRDAFADRLFPGTSTIQTRLRYMLFVPWIYRSLEQRRVPADKFALEARKLELSLVTPLLASEDGEGVFGRTAGSGLKRLPSSVYWAGLHSWKIRVADLSQDQYHRGIDGIYRTRDIWKRQAVDRPEGDEKEVAAEQAVPTWHSRLPRAPEGFPQQADFALTLDEASFLLDCMKRSQPDSLLVHLALKCKPVDVATPWEHPDLASFPAAIRELLDHGRRFSTTLHGAALVYNLSLAEKAARPDLVEAYRSRLADWTIEVQSCDVRGWSLERLWDLTVGAGHAISRATRAFVEAWVGAVRADASGLADSREARELVKLREQRLKGPHSRFLNERALDQWSGASGTGRMMYRWPNAKTLLADLERGLSSGAR